MMQWSNVTVSVPPSVRLTSMVWSSVNEPRPLSSVILFFFIRKCTPLTRPPAAVGQPPLDGVVVGHGAAAVDLGDLVLLHQEVHALDAPLGHGAAAPERGAVVEGDRAVDLDAERVLLFFEDVGEFGVAQQGLRRDAAHVQADTTPVLLDR